MYMCMYSYIYTDLTNLILSISKINHLNKENPSHKINFAIMIGILLKSMT